MVARQSGQVLLVALIVLLLVGAATSLLTLLTSSENRLILRQAREIRLVALSDAALAEALAHLSADDGFGGKQEHPLGQGVIESRVRTLGGGRIEILATARIGSRKREVRAVVRLQPSGPLLESWARLPVAARSPG